MYCINFFNFKKKIWTISIHTICQALCNGLQCNFLLKYCIQQTISARFYVLLQLFILFLYTFHVSLIFLLWQREISLAKGDNLLFQMWKEMRSGMFPLAWKQLVILLLFKKIINIRWQHPRAVPLSLPILSSPGGLLKELHQNTFLSIRKQ